MFIVFVNGIGTTGKGSTKFSQKVGIISNSFILSITSFISILKTGWGLVVFNVLPNISESLLFAVCEFCSPRIHTAVCGLCDPHAALQ